MLKNKVTFLMAIYFITSLLPAMDELDRKIGQMIMVGFSRYNNFEDTLYYDLENRNLGGVILMAHNIDGPSQLLSQTRSIQSHAADTAVFISTDQEGGIVARLDEQNGYSQTHSAYHLGTVINNEDSTRAQADKMGRWLSQGGINVNLAPCADVNINPSSPAIGGLDRSFSSDPWTVADHCLWTSNEFEKRHVISCLKHFPGHGSAVGDSHLGFTDVSDSWYGSELIPYGELIDNGYNGMIMAAHVFNAKFDSIYPASLSRATINGILRDSLNFNGVVISDGMSMGAVTNNYSFEDAAVLAVNAGTDILLYTTNKRNNRSLPAQLIRIIRSNVDSGVIPESRIHESYDRILALKSGIRQPVSIHPVSLPRVFTCSAYPNPFNIKTRIRININESFHGPARVSIFSARGERIASIHLDISGKGGYEIPWFGQDQSGRPLASGTYIFRVSLNGVYSHGKLTLLK